MIKLFAPGPTYITDEVLAKMAEPVYSHRSAKATAVQKSISENLQQLLNTQNTITLSTSSGTGLMEGAIRSFTRNKALVCSVGAFGKRWYELAKWQNIDADLLESEPGQPNLPQDIRRMLKAGNYDVVTLTHNETSTGIVHPLELYKDLIAEYPDIIWMLDTVSSMGGTRLELDRFGIDVCISSSQKALALPPGLAIAAVSKKAEKRLEELGPRGFYLDFYHLVEFVKEKDFQYISTPSLSHMAALEFQLNRIIKNDPEVRYMDHLEMCETTLDWANKYFEQFAAPGFESHTVTVIKNTRNISVSDVNKALLDKGFAIAGGYGAQKDSTFRIGHMGDLKPVDLENLLKELNIHLGL